MTVMEFGKIFWLEAPLDFGIARERAGSRTGDVGENAMVGAGEREIGGVSDHGSDVVLRAAN